MKKLRNLSVCMLISTLMLFVLIMPVFAGGADYVLRVRKNQK